MYFFIKEIYNNSFFNIIKIVLYLFFILNFIYQLFFLPPFFCYLGIVLVGLGGFIFCYF